MQRIRTGYGNFMRNANGKEKDGTWEMTSLTPVLVMTSQTMFTLVTLPELNVSTHTSICLSHWTPRVHMYTHTHTHTYSSICMYLCVCVYIYMYYILYIYYIYIDIYMHVCVCVYIYVCVCVYVYVYIYICIYVLSWGESSKMI